MKTLSDIVFPEIRSEYNKKRVEKKSIKVILVILIKKKKKKKLIKIV